MTHLVFSNSCSFKTTDLISSFKVLVQNFFVLEFSFMNNQFCPFQWNSDGPIFSEFTISLEIPRYSKSFFFNSSCFASLSSCEYIAFYLSFTLRFGIFRNMLSISGLTYWLAKNGKNAISIDISRYFNSSFSNLQLWVLLSKSKRILFYV